MMKNIFGACGAFLLAGLTLSAQATQPQTPAQPTDVGRIMTLTGCLKTWDPKAMAMGGGIGTSQPDSGPMNTGTQYVLTNTEDSSVIGAPMPSTAGTTAPTGATGATGAAQPGMAHTSYLLKGNEASLMLSKHVNHKVEVTGTLAVDHTAMAHSMPPATPAMPATAQAAPATTAVPTLLNVTVLKMVAATCP